MALDPGTRFGPYEIVDAIGAGGMGEVYRAHDTTLERDVAVKVLPTSFAEDAGRVERFNREAKTLASLNHPNIAQIYGLEKSDGTTALVMELVEGLTLEERIATGAIPADEALGIAMQIADALEAAHSQNIVHRDLKPANIKLKSDGTVKVLDFGIAKALAPENLVSGPQSPIMTTPATQVGVILGTAAYMSPEQAKGKAVDQRTDIWAFGCVLYEMLTGQLAFGAEDVATTLARVIANDTNLDTLPAGVSPAVRKTIELCLRKDPIKRVADIRDVKLALEGSFEPDYVGSLGQLGQRRSVWQRALPHVLTVLATTLVLAVATWEQWRAPGPDTSRSITRFQHRLEPDQYFRLPAARVLAISPDGRNVVYNTNTGIYLRALDEFEARLIPGTAGDLYSPTFSPDGQWVAFVDAGTREVKRIAVSGGAPVVMATLPSQVGNLSWGFDDTLLVDADGGIFRVAANGGTPELVIPAGADESLYGARMLPDGDSILFSVNLGGSGRWDDAQIAVQSISTGERTVVLTGGADARYVPGGHLVYALGDGLFAVAFDLESLTASGGAIPLVQGVMRPPQGETGAANFEIAVNGTLAYVAGRAAAVRRRLTWVDRMGRETDLGAPPRYYSAPRISPDGTRIALDVRDADHDIWIWELGRESLTRFTFDSAEDEFPLWTPDGERLLFTRGNRTLYWQRADGSGEPEQLIERSGQIFAAEITSDGGAAIVFGAAFGSEQDDIELFDLTSRNEPTDLIATEFVERDPALSPDGRWLAYSSTESGREEVFVRRFPDIRGGRWPISTDGGQQPLWGPDGRELFYRGDGAVMVVSIEADTAIRAGRPEVLVRGDYATAPGGRTYDYDPSGDRFLMIKSIEDTSSAPQIIIVENWIEELKRLVPTE